MTFFFLALCRVEAEVKDGTSVGNQGSILAHLQPTEAPFPTDDRSAIFSSNQLMKTDFPILACAGCVSFLRAKRKSPWLAKFGQIIARGSHPTQRLLRLQNPNQMNNDWTGRLVQKSEKADVRSAPSKLSSCY
jgi:hypothetical protein